MTNLRVGIGVDLHCLVPGKSLVLGGISIPSLMRCQAHSDGDVLIHALVDALLGAANLGDIGEHFPTSDPRFEGISSLFFLQKCLSLLQNEQYCIVNIDAVVILESPRLTSYKDAMRENLALLLQLDKDWISVKAKTNEKIDTLGKNLAISAQVVVLLERVRFYVDP